jgi:outer membrane protein assembly factor BamB
MKKIAALGFLCLCVFFFLSTARPAGPPRLAWKVSGPANPEYEWVTMSTTGGGLVFTILKGKTWTFTTENGTFNETGSEIIALDLSGGQKKWSFNTQFPINSPLLFLDGKLIVHDGYGDVFCLEAASGREIWKAERELHPGSWDEQTLPSAKDGSLYLREENELLCRGLKDGQAVWRTPIEAVSNRRVFPALINDKIVLSTAMDEALCINSKDGRVLWKKKIGWLKDTVVAGGQTIFLANADALQCLSLADGGEIWSYVAPPLETSANPQPPAAPKIPAELWNVENAQALAAGNNHLFIVQKRVRQPQGTLAGYEIACLSMDNKKPVWTYSLEEPFAGFSLAGQAAIVVQGARVTLLNSENGNLLWDFQIPEEKGLQGQALAVAGKILVVGTKGLYCIDTGDPRISGWPQCGGGATRSGRPG